MRLRNHHHLRWETTSKVERAAIAECQTTAATSWSPTSDLLSVSLCPLLHAGLFLDFCKGTDSEAANMEHNYSDICNRQYLGLKVADFPLNNQWEN